MAHKDWQYIPLPLARNLFWVAVGQVRPACFDDLADAPENLKGKSSASRFQKSSNSVLVVTGGEYTRGSHGKRPEQGSRRSWMT